MSDEYYLEKKRDYTAYANETLTGPDGFMRFVELDFPTTGDYWGDWVYDARRLCVTYRNYYDVDLEDMKNSAKTLDWVFQVAAHEFDIANFIRAVQDLIRPQANLCSWGGSKKFNPTKWLKEHAGTAD